MAAKPIHSDRVVLSFQLFRKGHTITLMESYPADDLPLRKLYDYAVARMREDKFREPQDYTPHHD